MFAEYRYRNGYEENASESDFGSVAGNIAKSKTKGLGESSGERIGSLARTLSPPFFPMDTDKSHWPGNNAHRLHICENTRITNRQIKEGTMNNSNLLPNRENGIIKLQKRTVDIISPPPHCAPLRIGCFWPAILIQNV